MLIWDSTIIIVIPAVILAAIAQIMVRAAFNKWSRVEARSGYTGAQVSQILLQQGAARLGSEGSGLMQVGIQPGEGLLSDHYNPLDRTLNLSPEVYSGSSIASLAVAAHETGHAFQHATGYGPMWLRSILVPAATAGQLSWLLFVIGLFVHLPVIQNIAIWIFAAATLFTFVTLPVEFNASKRALQMLEAGGYLNSDEVPQAKQVLDAAALTYVAATAVALTQLLRLILLRNSRRRG